MEGSKPRGRLRLGMLDDLITASYVDMKRKQKIEKDGKVICHGPAVRQYTERDRDKCSLIL